MYKYLLFDLDRTLWDFEGNANITFQHMYRDFDLLHVCHTDYETFHSVYRQINDNLWEAYRNGTITKDILYVRRFSMTLEHFNAPADIVASIAPKMGDYYVYENPKQKGLMPGCREMLDYLEATHKYELCIITNGFSEAQLPKMKTAGIDHYFQHFFLSETLGHNKPDRRFFDAALQQINADPKDCIVIGDDFHVDIAGAHSAGIDQIYYNPLNHPKGDFEPTYEIKHLLDLKNIF